MIRPRLAVAAAFAVAGLVAVVGVAVAQTVTHTAEVRIVAQRLDDGRVEFGLQQREGAGWGERILPQRRFFPVSSQGRWLSSSPIEVGIEVEAPTPTPTATPVAGVGDWTYFTGEGIDGTYAGYGLEATAHSGYDWEFAPILYARCGGPNGEWDDVYIATPFLIQSDVGDDGLITVRSRFHGEEAATTETWWSDEESDSAVFATVAFGFRLAAATGTLYVVFIDGFTGDTDTATFDVTGAAAVADALECFP